MDTELIKKEEYLRLLKKVNDLKSIQIDNYFIGNYCDALDINKQWCVAEIIDRNDDKIKIHFEGWSNKFDEEFIIGKSRKIATFRRFSKGYTGQTGTAYRIYSLKQEDLAEIQQIIREINSNNLQNLENPLQITQLLRGKIFTYIDIFLTCNLDISGEDTTSLNQNNNTRSTSNSVRIITGLLIDYLNLTAGYLEYFKNNIRYSEVIDKYNGLFLIDETCAVMASYFEILLTLKRIFGMDERTSVFYSYHDQEVIQVIQSRMKSIQLEKICKENCYKQNFTFKNVHTIIIASMIDYFNSIHGFTLLFEILFTNFDSISTQNTNSNSNPISSTPFYVIYHFFQIFEMIEPFIDYTVHFSSELMRFKEYLMCRISKMTELEVKEVDKFFIEGIAKSLRTVYNIDGEDLAAGIIYEELLLNYNFKCFTSKNLEKRIKGISYINRAAEAISKKDQMKSLMMEDNDIEEYNFLDANYLFHWMKEKNILEELLGENIHEEILKRSASIFMSYAKKSEISKSVFDSMWKALIERHESISTVIKSLLCTLSLGMNDADKEYNFGNIKLIPLASYNEQLLKFIKDLTVNCIRSDQIKKMKSQKFLSNRISESECNLYGIPLIFHFLLDVDVNRSLYINMNMQEEILKRNKYIETALECLKEILENTTLDLEVYKKFILYCVDNLTHGNSVVQILKFLKIILNMQTNRYNAESGHMITMLNQSFMILDTIIQDMKRYFDVVEKKVRNSKSCEEDTLMIETDHTPLPTVINSLNLSIINSNSAREYISIIFEGTYTHIINIETRLDLIHFLLNYSETNGTPLEITSDHIIKLWDILVLNTRTENEKQILYKFLLQSNTNGGNSDEFSERICEGLFTRILTNSNKFNPERINLIAFKLFQKYFYLINRTHDRLIVLNRKIKISSIDILGESTLWEIITQNRNENVRRECSKVLTSICLNSLDTEEEFCLKLWNKFLSNIINNLHNSFDHDFLRVKSPIAIKGLIFLIKTFILELNSTGGACALEEDLIPELIKPFAVTFIHIGKNEKRPLNIGNTEFVYQVREKASFYFGVPVQRLAFKQNRKLIDIKDDMKIFKEMIDANYVVEIIEMTNPFYEFKNSHLKLLILENEYIFDTLFSFLEYNRVDQPNSLNTDAVCLLNDAWELINKLPKNKKLMEKIYSLGANSRDSLPTESSKEWKLNLEKNLQIFESNSIFVLSYLIKIMKVFVEKDPLWVINFISNTGVKILLNILMKVKEKNFTDGNNLGVDCIKDIFEIFDFANQIYSEKYQASLYDLKVFKIHDGQIIYKLFEIIFYIFKGCFEKDNDLKLKEIQCEYTKKRNREMIHRLFLNNNNKKKVNLISEKQETNNVENINENITIIKNEENNLEDIDEVHSTIRKIWNSEVDSVTLIFNFLNNFKSDRIVEILIKNINSPDEISDSNQMNIDHENECFEDNYCKGILFNLLTWCLIFPKNTKIKEILLQRIISFNSKCDLELRNNFYKTIFRFLFTKQVLILPKNDRVCNSSNDNVPCEFFYQTILLFLSKYKKYNTRIDFRKIAGFMIDYLYNEKVFPNSKNEISLDMNNSTNEKILIGFLSILRELVLSQIEKAENFEYFNSQNLIEFLIKNYLFTKCQRNSSTSNTSLLFTSQGRRAAYRLLTAISYNLPECISYIIQTLSDFHQLGFWRSKRLSDWSITAAEEKSSTGLTGLKNLGCTCYMNALIQQFYMIPSIRQGILNAPDSIGIKDQESVLFQLKAIFASLLASDRKFHNPKDFCQVFRNYDNQIMNVTEQMDVDEFFNLLLDRLEPYMKGSPQENLFRNHFTGLLVNQSICVGCPHYSETIEQFSSIILSVKNKKSVNESLESFVKGEMLEGDNAYYCDKCEKKVNTLRRQCIKQLPNVLVLVMKRFEFNYDTMVKLKVNDYCEFPHELNMEAYTQEYLSHASNTAADTTYQKISTDSHKSASGYDYALTGVIIHTGNADGGHYYSLIKSIEEGSWYEFNDAYVTPYDLNDLADEAYGGKKQKINDREISNLFRLQEKGTNAYVLLYTKKTEIEKLTEKKFHKSALVSQIQPNILQTIQADNHQYWVSKIIFSDEYCEFIQDLIVNYNTASYTIYKQPMLTKNSNFENESLYKRDVRDITNLNIPESLFVTGLILPSTNSFDYMEIINCSKKLNQNIFNFACSIFFTSIIRYKEKKYIASFMDILKANINFNIENAIWLLEEFSNSEILTEFVVECPNAELRKLTCGLLYCAMLKISKEEFFLSDLNKLKNGEEIESNSLLNMIQIILYLMNRKKQFLGKDFTFFYFLIWRFATLTIETKEFLISRNFLKFLIKFFNSKNFPGLNLANRSALIEDSLIIKLREPKHKELSIKLMDKKEKLTPFEEIIEKKQLEKLFLPSDAYLLNTFCEIISSSDLNEKFPLAYLRKEKSHTIHLPSEYKTLINLKDKLLLRSLINEARGKQATIHLSKLFCYLSYENLENTIEIVAILCEYLNLVDVGEVDTVIKLLRNMMLIEDSVQESRISMCLDNYFLTIIANLKYYKFTEYNIDFVIKFFNKHFSLLEPFISKHISSFVKLIQWLKENPFAPFYSPSKTTVMFKKRNINYANRNTSQIEEQLYVQSYKDKSDTRKVRLMEIVKKNVPLDTQITYESDIDLMDFKFSVNDKIKFENFECNVLCVLDEMIFVEPQKDLLYNRKAPNALWIETDRNIEIISLNSSMKDF